MKDETRTYTNVSYHQTAESVNTHRMKLAFDEWSMIHSTDEGGNDGFQLVYSDSPICIGGTNIRDTCHDQMWLARAINVSI